MNKITWKQFKQSLTPKIYCHVEGKKVYRGKSAYNYKEVFYTLKDAHTTWYEKYRGCEPYETM